MLFATKATCMAYLTCECIRTIALHFADAKVLHFADGENEVRWKPVDGAFGEPENQEAHK